MVCGRSRSQALYSSVYSAEAVSNLITDPRDRSGLKMGRWERLSGCFWIFEKSLCRMRSTSAKS